ncbi:MAG TPA: hypothetical protein VEL74_20500, partial [Thermoanaerobaculia bacterium]|nr:hypothetical protein [Thermoanaerobaculia bacterium]
APAADLPTTSATAVSVQASVTWLDDGTANGAWIVNPDKITVSARIELLVYTMSDKSTPGVRFLSSTPLVWISPPQPDNFDAQVSEDGRQLFIADRNQTTGLPEAFSFRLLAVYDDITRISPDPMIINLDPS